MLQRVLDRGLAANLLPAPVPIVSVDFASRVAGRALYLVPARCEGLAHRTAVAAGSGLGLRGRPMFADRIAESFDGAALVAIDAVSVCRAPSGCAPRALTSWRSPKSSVGVGRARAFFGSARADWSPASPFFAVPAGPVG
ncbi:MAG: hypothetical protein IPK00_20990 [Deltaproteobacteria bacterium]|nr:hypothetical protein [Deltaproteobacteria bacterium]